MHARADMLQIIARLPAWSALLTLLTAWGCVQEAQPSERRRQDADAESKQSIANEQQSAASRAASSGDDDDHDDDDDDDDDDNDNDNADDDDGEGNDGTSRKLSIKFRGSRGDQVPGYLWMPAGGGRHPAVLVMYGIQGDKDDDDVRAVAEYLNKKGLAAMTLDWPGTGDRGDIPSQDRILQASVMSWTVADYGAAVDYLADRDDIDTKHIGFAGASMGAMTGLAFSARDKRVKAVVAIVPIPNPLWGQDDPTARIAAVNPRPVLCVHTKENVDLSGVVCNNVGSKGKRQAVAADHELTGMREQIAEDAAAFLVKHLK